ncbi:MAG: radical SAM protein [Chlorobi bacterium]|nr:radical SAM protein [Chlorobiota bacterium]
MRYYKILKLNSLISNYRLKFFGLWLLHIFNKRYLAVNFDPVLACNFRCKMCYFTDPARIKLLKGYFPEKEIPLFGKAILNRALKLQIGCGAEPTLYRNLDTIIKTAVKHNVPYISLTTNASLITRQNLENWVSSGLNEITISLHGVNKDTYEYFMQNGKFENFQKVLKITNKVKSKYPSFKIRINYTFNEDNFSQLKFFFKEFGDIDIDILQIRPIDKIGETEYHNFKLDKIIPEYLDIYNLLKKETRKRNITFIAPTFKQINSRSASIDSVISAITYCYISPNHFCKDDFHWRDETYNEFCKRTNMGSEILKYCFYSKSKIEKLKNKSLNYSVS